MEEEKALTEVSEGQRALITQFQQITSDNMETALDYLKQTNWNLPQALEIHYHKPKTIEYEELINLESLVSKWEFEEQEQQKLNKMQRDAYEYVKNLSIAASKGSY